jgi:hypothetical protein
MFVSTSYKKLEQKRFLGTSLKIEFFGYNFWPELDTKIKRPILKSEFKCSYKTARKLICMDNDFCMVLIQIIFL